MCLLRGVNVGGRNTLAMRELRALFESLGYDDVETFIQSGNVVFSSTGPVDASALAGEIWRSFALDVGVVLRSAAALGKVLAANPFGAEDPDHVHVAFMASKPAAALVKQVSGEGLEPERFSLKGTEIYFHLPNGMGRAKLPALLDRRLQVVMTIRNWRTTERLAELAGRTLGPAESRVRIAALKRPARRPRS